MDMRSSIRVWLTSLPQDSHVSHSQLPVNKQAKMTLGTCGQLPSDAYALYDHDTHSWKTSQVSFLPGTSEQFSGDWPKSGMMQNGVCSELTIAVPHIGERDCGYWPTPAQRDWKGGSDTVSMENGRFVRTSNTTGTKWGAGLDGAVRADQKMWPSPAMEEKKMWPTASSRDWKDSPGMAQTGTNPDGSERNRTDQLARAVYVGGKQTPQTYPTPSASSMIMPWVPRENCTSHTKAGHVGNELIRRVSPNEKPQGQLNPDWVEFLMGWPIGMTSLNPLSEDRFLAWLWAFQTALID